ncbi:MAG: MFS transporter, partial [Actinomycetota bacterium]
MSADVAARLYDLLIDDDATGSDDVEPEVAEAAPGNTLRIVSALTLQKIGDRIADPKSVLSWLLVTVGAPAGLTGLLVPIRESGSLLPQAAMLPRIRRVERRSRVWVAGAVGQALAVAAIAATAVGLRGIAAGIAVLAALAAFAVSRAMSSIAYKDVLGRTIPKGQRGQVSGLASVTSGVVTIALGLGLRLVGQDSGAAVLGGLLAAGAVMWAIAAVVFATVREPTDVESSSSDDREDVSTLATLRHDAPFRRFVTARALLLVSALSPPFVVALSNEEGEAALAQLGLFVVAQGL